MAVDFEFTARPFKLRVARQVGSRPVRWTHVRPFAWPDSLYRQAVRRAVAALIAENRELRRDYRRRERRLPTMLAETLARALQERQR